MSIREYIVDIFQNEYLLAKINNSDVMKGIESDLRFLFEQSFYSRTNKISETETDGRTDLKLPLDQLVLIEMTCFNGILSEEPTQKKIKKDLLKLSKNKSEAIKIFLYFGLYGKTQLPTYKDAFVPVNRLEEIKNEINEIHKFAKTKKIDLTVHEYYCKTLPDRILYAAWFYLK